jgi:secondary thiamine-phosphate synthase enzyme
LDLDFRVKPETVPHYAESFALSTQTHHAVVDVTREVQEIIRRYGRRDGQVCVYTPHATAAVTINENDDPNIGTDFLRALERMVPEHDGWLHDQIDNNAAAHIKSALVGPSVTIPLVDGNLALGRWQNVFFCEFDGPRSHREVIVSIAF